MDSQITGTGKHFTAATRHSTSCSEDNISSERRASGSKEHIKEAKIADSVLSSLFMCNNIMVQHCPPPLAPASADLYQLNSIFKLTQFESNDPKGPENI